MKHKICLALLLFGCASFTSAQDETPTSVTVQNRTGDLPFSQTVGTGVEHVDIGSGNLIVDFPIVSLPGRHMPFNYGLRYNALFWTVASRTQANGQQSHYLEHRAPALHRRTRQRFGICSYTAAVELGSLTRDLRKPRRCRSSG